MPENLALPPPEAEPLTLKASNPNPGQHHTQWDTPEQVDLSLQSVYLLPELLPVCLFTWRQLLTEVVHPGQEAESGGSLLKHVSVWESETACSGWSELSVLWLTAAASWLIVKLLTPKDTEGSQPGNFHWWVIFVTVFTFVLTKLILFSSSLETVCFCWTCNEY